MVRPGIVFKRPSLQGLILKGEYPETREGVGVDFINEKI
jgi:hypothetical protein